MRSFTVETKPLPANRLLAFHARAATAQEREFTVEFDTTLGLGGVTLAVTVRRDRVHVTETADLRAFLSAWADAIIHDMRGETDAGQGA